MRLWVEGESVLVPSVTKRNVKQAMDTLEEARLRPRITDQELVVEGPADTVLSQDPQPEARVAPGTTVNLTVTRSGVTVPSVQYRDIRTAQKMLNDSGLKGRVVRRKLMMEIPGDVIDQDPKPGQVVARGTVIELTIAERGVRVPDLVGQTEQNAVSLLRRSGLKASIKRVPGNDTNVIEQAPKAYTIVRPGSSVSIVVHWPVVR